MTELAPEHRARVDEIKAGGRRGQIRLPPRTPAAGLSPRELQILRLVAAGLSNREIGKELWISPFTVGDHLKHITAKLAARNRTHAVARGYDTGVLP